MHSFTDEKGKRWTACCECNRGGNGNDKDKCSCGWKSTTWNNLGCFLGTAIEGDIKPQPKISKAKQNYQNYLNSDCCESFREWMGFKNKRRLTTAST